MGLNGIDVVVVVVAVAVGALTYVSLLRAFRRAVAEMRLDTERQLNAFTMELNALQLRPVDRSQAIGSAGAPVPEVELAAPSTTARMPQTEEVGAEMLVVMAAAVTTFLGKKVRVRSAKMMQSPYEIVNPWSQQGRVVVQASHNLRQS